MELIPERGLTSDPPSDRSTDHRASVPDSPVISLPRARLPGEKRRPLASEGDIRRLAPARTSSCDSGRQKRQATGERDDTEPACTHELAGAGFEFGSRDSSKEEEGEKSRTTPPSRSGPCPTRNPPPPPRPRPSSEPSKDSPPARRRNTRERCRFPRADRGAPGPCNIASDR